MDKLTLGIAIATAVTTIIIKITTTTIINITTRDINFMLGTKLGPYWLICWGFLCPVLLPLLLTYVLVTQVLIIIINNIIDLINNIISIIINIIVIIDIINIILSSFLFFSPMFLSHRF